MNKLKLPDHQAAFTLLELIIVVLIVALLGGYAASRFSNKSYYQQDTVVEQLIAAGRLAQQLSMNDSTRSFLLVTSGSQVDLQVTQGATTSSFAAADISYPLNFGSDVSLSSASISFNSLGESSGATVTVTLDSAINLCFLTSGLIQRC